MGTFATEFDKVLELGSGSGGNVQFVQQRDATYYGVDGSETAVERLRKAWPDAHFAACDFTRGQPFGGDFDLVIDRASIAHNDTEGVLRCADVIYDALKPGGIFISSDWFSTWHSEFTRGRKVDARTRTDYPDGQFFGIGCAHFSDEEEFAEVFQRFQGVHLEERTRKRIAPNAVVQRPFDFRYISHAFAAVDYRNSVWDLVLRKPK